MNGFMFRAAIAGAAIVTCTSCAAYECGDAESYRKGLQELKLVQQVNVEQLGSLVKSIQITKGIDFNTALWQVVQAAMSGQTKAYDDRLVNIETQIKATKRDSPETCDALLLLLRQYTVVRAQKMDFISKLVTGEDDESDPLK